MLLNGKHRQEPALMSSRTAILKSKFRRENQDEETPEARRREHQRELAERVHAAGIARFVAGQEHFEPDKKKTLKKYESYKHDQAIPTEVQDLRIYVDKRGDTVLLPIFGLAVPFHISTLRLNFLTPGQGVAKKDDLPFDDLSANFIRTLTYRSADIYRLTEIYKEITEMKKQLTKREIQKKDMQDVVRRDQLVVTEGRRLATLPDVFAKPTFDTKRLPGKVEIHQNGMRYVSPTKKDNSIDILFNNVRHLFFQPCDHELIVLLHFHLRSPIMIGKKKTQDIQFYREASDAQFDETGGRRRHHFYGDEDEMEAEEEERRRRKVLNNEFRAFSEKITEASGGQVEVDIPIRSLGFNGVPFRANVLLQPTTDCLVHLTDSPFLVVTISDIEIAHLERVQFGLKNFDLVFVFKDFSKPPLHINTIPMTQLDTVKEWLDSVDVSFTEGHLNLNWTTIMKTINENPAAFFEEGGWSFLDPNAAEDEDDVSEGSTSEFEPSQSEEEEEYSDEDSYGSGEEEDDASFSEEEELGEDWDALEEKARKEDERRNAKRKGSLENETATDNHFKRGRR